MFGNRQTCPQCGEKISKGANFCGKCGFAFAGGALRCGACGAENRGDASFCKECGQPLSASAAPVMRNHRWARSEEDFAVRIDADDVTGFLKHGLIIDPGTNALLVDKGAVVGTVAPGEYTLDSFGGRLKELFAGRIPESLTALLVEVTPTEFDFNLGGIFTSDPLRIGATVRLQAEVVHPGKFLVNMLKGRERISKEALRQHLYPEVVQVVERWVRQHTLQELADDFKLKDRLELLLDETLKTTMAQNGLSFLNVRVLELNMEQLERILDDQARVNETRRLYALQVTAAEAEAEGRKHIAEAQRELDLVKLAEETRTVEMDEKRVALHQRMRAAVMSDRMNEITSEAEFEQFLHDMDYDKLLREKEREELLRTWKEDADDHQMARAHLLAKLEVEQAYEVRAIELRLSGEYNETKLNQEISLTRKKADFEWEMKRKNVEEELWLEREKIRIDDERKRLAIEQKRLSRQQEFQDDMAEAEGGIRLLALMKANRRLDEEERRRIQREDELEILKAKQTLALERMEAEERLRVGERQFELDRLERLGQLGAEALIAASGAEQGRILADLKKTEALQGMSEEQILAAAAKDSPEVARALQEKFRAVAAGQTSKEIAEMYERMLAERDTSLEQLRQESEKRVQDVSEAWDKSSARSQETAERALDRVADTAQAFAKGQSGAPVIVTGSGASGPQVISTSGAPVSPAGSTQKQKDCPNCALPVAATAKFCDHCGHKFEGV